MKSKKKNNIYKNLIENKNNNYELLYKYINNENITKFSKIIDTIQNNNSFKNMHNSLFPKQFSEIGCGTNVGYANTFYRSLFWIASLIESNKDYINEFINYKNDFEINLLNNNYDLCEDILNRLDKNICCSIWSFKNHILLRNMKYENVTEYIKSQELSTEIYQYAVIFASLTNINNESNNYNSVIEGIINNLNAANIDYYKYILGINNTLTSEYSNYVFVNASNVFTIIDLYILVKDLFRSKSIDLSINRNVQVLKLLCNNIKDEELLSLENLINNKTPITNDNLVDLIEHFKNKDYKGFIKKFYTGINYNNSYFLLNLLAISVYFERDYFEKQIKNNTILDEIIESMSNVICCNNYPFFHYHVDRLTQYSKALSDTTISKQIEIFLDYYTAGKKYPLQYKCYHNFDLLFINRIINDLPPLFIESIDKIICNCNSYNEIDKLFDSNNKLFFSITARIKYNMAINKNDITYALNVFSELRMDNNMTILSLDTTVLDDYVEKQFINYSEISPQELIYIYSSYYLSKYRKDAYKNFIHNNNIKEPLNISRKIYDNRFVLYFLKEITTTSTLELLYNLFSSDDDIDNYRIKILKNLIKIDPNNKKQYSKEMSSISKDISLRVMQQDIDESKLSVDFGYIKQNIYDKFSSMVRMYFDTPNQEIIIDYPDSEISCNSIIINTIDAKKQIQKVELRLCYSRHIILKEMFNVYAKEFCFGHKGLDTFMSTRVRHGIFSNEITNVFSEHNIIGVDNCFYSKMFKNKTLSQGAIEIIKTLSDNIENLLLFHTGKVFKVFIDDPIDKAVFDYNIKKADLEYILYHKDFKTCSTVNAFIDIISDSIINKTNTYLDEIKDNILEKLSYKLLKLLDNFLTEIKPFCLTEKSYDDIRNNITHCKTDVQKELNVIKNWFNLSSDDFNINYMWDDLIKVTINSIKKQSDSFSDVSISRSINSSSFLRGMTFSYLYDIFQIAIYNALQHSNYENLKKLKIGINIKETENEFVILFVNNVSSKANKRKLQSDIERINEIFSKKEYHENTNREGGMGLIKIMNILFSIMNLNGDFSVDYKENSFNLSIIINKEGVVVDN